MKTLTLVRFTMFDFKKALEDGTLEELKSRPMTSVKTLDERGMQRFAELVTIEDSLVHRHGGLPNIRSVTVMTSDTSPRGFVLRISFHVSPIALKIEDHLVAVHRRDKLKEIRKRRERTQILTLTA